MTHETLQKKQLQSFTALLVYNPNALPRDFMQQKHYDKFFAAVIAFTAHQLRYVWIDNGDYGWIRSIANSQDSRPFVYRMLLPFLSRLAEKITGVDAVACLFFLIVLSGIGFYYSVRYLYTTFRDDAYTDIITFAVCEFTIILLLVSIEVYDLASVMFFTLSLALLANRKYWLFFVIFPIATLNRETTILLTGFFALYLWNKLPRRVWIGGTLYQAIVYILIKLAVNRYFAHLPGMTFDWAWREVLIVYWHRYMLTGLILLIMLALLYFILKQWKKKPEFLRAAFLLIFPALVVIHLLIGQAFELRVLGEIFPVTVMLAMYPTRSSKDESVSSEISTKELNQRLNDS